MALRVTIDVFSGRENPVIEVSEEEAAKYLTALRPHTKLAKADAALAASTALGYRGMVVEQVKPLSDALPASFRVTADRLTAPQLSHMASGAQFEEEIIHNHRADIDAKYGAHFSDWLLDGVTARRKGVAPSIIPPVIIPPFKICKPVGCAFRSPAPDLAWWNDGQIKQARNNCYNYSTNYRSDTFAQPGRATGTMYGAISGAEVLAAATRDQLVPAPAANNKFPPEGHLVALVVAPGYDFHWYRKGQDGRWTHKPGSTQATNLDNAGKVIEDPRTANRGPYTEFVSFMAAIDGHIILR